MANSLAILCCLSVLCFAAMFDYSEAECCYSACRGYCLDCTRGTPYCGYSSCNIFGCNCGGGCRRPTNPVCRHCNYYGSDDQNAVAVTDAKDVFTQLDLNGDGRVDVEETIDWLRRRGHSTTNVAEKFQALDRNQDKFLSLAEIDA